MQTFTDAAQAVAWIHNLRWTGQKSGLTNTQALLDALGHPERRMGRMVHVAGTNGKGSTCALVERGLRACGYRTGLFTSPYLCRFAERIRVDGVPIPDAALIDCTERVRAACDALAQRGVYCTTFELMTAVAVLYFAESHTEYAVIEVGMGGLLDPTNALPSDLCLIAAIGLDHMKELGDTVEQIALQKAGIIKSSAPVAVTVQAEAIMAPIRQAAKAHGAPLFEVPAPAVLETALNSQTFVFSIPFGGTCTQRIRLNGSHQRQNAVLARTGLALLGVNSQLASEGMACAQWPGRLEWIGSWLIDSAHNPQAAHTLAEYVQTAAPVGGKIVLLTGMMKDKAIEECAAIMTSFADEVITTAVDDPRAVAPDQLARLYGEKAHDFPTIEAAFDAARRAAGAHGIVVVAGSLYLTGAIRNRLLPDDDGRL